MIDHELRFNPNRARIRDMIANGDLGEIRHVNIANIGNSWADPGSRRKGDWWSDAAQGGGRLGANGSHQVDMLRWWLGEVALVTGAAPVMVPGRVDKATGEAWTATADDVAYFTLNMESGALAQVFMSGVAAHNIGNLTQVFGSKGTITLDNRREALVRQGRAGVRGDHRGRPERAPARPQQGHLERLGRGADAGGRRRDPRGARARARRHLPRRVPQPAGARCRAPVGRRGAQHPPRGHPCLT
jgi:predicted dehydrogenase